MKSIVYIGNFSFPLGNAAGKRVYYNGKVLRELGYEVIFIGVDKNILDEDYLVSTKKSYDGFTYYNFKYPTSKFDWINYKMYFNNFKDFLVSENIKQDLEAIIYYGSPTLSLFISKLLKYCKQNEIKVISDCVDWLTPRTANPIFNVIKWADNTFQKTYLNRRTDGLIVISKYLNNYYKSFDKKTLIVPPLAEKIYANQSYLNMNEKIITYAGIPFRKGEKISNVESLKDRIDITIELLSDVKDKGTRFIFNIYGFSKEEYIFAVPWQKEIVEKLDKSIVFHGSKSNEIVMKEISKSDFTILIRDVNKDTTAGFPTKVSESICCGTPVITTRTSDIEDYLIDGKTGFFIDLQNRKYSVVKIIEILGKSKTEIYDYKMYCSEFSPFYYKKYVEKTRFFLNKVIEESF